MALDFGGYLKGVALDRAAAILHERGVANALINIGGNVMALGSKNGKPWRVGIQHPRQPGPLATVELKDGEAIGTSGDYQRFFELDGAPILPPARPAQRRAGDAHAGADGADGSAPRRRHAVRRRRRSRCSSPAPNGRASPRSSASTEVLRVDADGHVQVSAALSRAGCHFVGGKPAALEIID